MNRVTLVQDCSLVFNDMRLNYSQKTVLDEFLDWGGLIIAQVSVMI